MITQKNLEARRAGRSLKCRTVGRWTSLVVLASLTLPAAMATAAGTKQLRRSMTTASESLGTEITRTQAATWCPVVRKAAAKMLSSHRMYWANLANHEPSAANTPLVWVKPGQGWSASLSYGGSWLGVSGGLEGESGYFTARVRSGKRSSEMMSDQHHGFVAMETVDGPDRSRHLVVGKLKGGFSAAHLTTTRDDTPRKTTDRYYLQWKGHGLRIWKALGQKLLERVEPYRCQAGQDG